MALAAAKASRPIPRPAPITTIPAPRPAPNLALPAPKAEAACVATFNSRSSVCVEQDVSVLQILGLWSHLQVFLEGIAALEG